MTKSTIDFFTTGTQVGYIAPQGQSGPHGEYRRQFKSDKLVHIEWRDVRVIYPVDRVKEYTDVFIRENLNEDFRTFISGMEYYHADIAIRSAAAQAYGKQYVDEIDPFVSYEDELKKMMANLNRLPTLSKRPVPYSPWDQPK